MSMLSEQSAKRIIDRMAQKERAEIRDSGLVQQILALMDGVEWTSDTLGDIAQVLVRAGYRVRDLNDIDREPEPLARVDPTELADGSTVYDVGAVLAGVRFTFGCVDEAHALALTSAINELVSVDADL